MKLSVSRKSRGKRVRITATPVTPPSLAELRKYLHTRVSKVWREATREFVITLADNIHVDTGMSVSSTLSLAAKVHAASEIQRGLAERIENTKRKGYGGANYAGDGSYHPDQFRSRAHGKRLGQEAVANKTHYVSFGSPDDLDFKLNFEIVVYQHDFHETNSNWRSINKAKAAFIRYWKKNIGKQVKKKDLLDWLIGGKIRANR